jgi:hypothetical protein
MWRGRYYEVWQQSAGGVAATLGHLSLKGVQGPFSVPRCADVLQLARVAKSGLLAAVPGRGPVVLDLSKTAHPPDWLPARDNPAALELTGSGTLTGNVHVPGTDTYRVWVQGSFRSRLQVYVDGKLVGDERHELNYSRSQFEPLGQVSLTGGSHEVKIHYGGPDLHPGSDGNEVIPETWPPHQFAIGPLVLSSGTTGERISYVNPANAHTLCDKSLDWIEAIAH